MVWNSSSKEVIKAVDSKESIPYSSHLFYTISRNCSYVPIKLLDVIDMVFMKNPHDASNYLGLVQSVICYFVILFRDYICIRRVPGIGTIKSINLKRNHTSSVKPKAIKIRREYLDVICIICQMKITYLLF